jgi:3-phosphoshikimate 1-carboxyvinyltransferase
VTDYLVIPPAKEVRGVIDAPPSKSATNRAYVLAALSDEPVEIVRPLESEDTVALERCLRAMGARIERLANGLRIGGPLSGPSGREVALDAGESGTAARFLTALAAVTPGRFLVTGSARLRERPMGDLVRALQALGASIEFRGEKENLPVSIAGGEVSAPRVTVDASRSSQFLSALLLAGAAREGGLEVDVTGPIASAPYVAMTIEALRAFGHDANEGSPFRVFRAARPVSRYEVSGDYSSAIALLAAAGAAGGAVVVRRLRWPGADADARALPVLESMGLKIGAKDGSVSAAREGKLLPVTVRATDFPDGVPALAALAALAEGESRFEGIGHLRLKESDRISALESLVTAAGGQAGSEGDTLVIGGPLPAAGSRPRRLPTSNDHRIAMAAALLSLARPGFLIENPGCVAKSYPGFFRDLETVIVRSR